MKTDDVKNAMYMGMIKNFERDGFLTPTLFFVKDNTPIIMPIPSDMLETPDGKIRIASMIKSVCTLPMVSGAGLIIEGYAKKFDKDDEVGKLVLNGNIKLNELNDKEDIILMIFSTPYEEIMMGHYVDCENIVVGEKMEDFDQFSGMFSGFFNWNKN